MPANYLANVKKALGSLNPAEIRESCERPLKILILSRSESTCADLEDYLLPAGVSVDKRSAALESLMRAGDPPSRDPLDLLFYEEGIAIPRGWRVGQDAFAFDLEHVSELPITLLAARSEFELALARRFPPFRSAAAKRIIKTVAKENALFSIMTALPNVIPNLAELPWAIGEFASDTAVLTANQIRMAFFLAGASDRTVGFREQRNEIGSIVAGAWGWRSIARELMSKVPFGGGLIPKAAIAYAGTYVVGLSLERVYRVGYGLSREERAKAFEAAKEHGKEVARALLARVRGNGE